MSEKTDALAQGAIKIAAHGAAMYLQKNGLRADAAALAECLKSWVLAKLPEALADAKKALDCHMDTAAAQTFAATMLQAGIEAAKEASTLKAVTP